MGNEGGMVRNEKDKETGARPRFSPYRHLGRLRGIFPIWEINHLVFRGKEKTHEFSFETVRSMFGIWITFSWQHMTVIDFS